MIVMQKSYDSVEVGGGDGEERGGKGECAVLTYVYAVTADNS